MTGFEETERWTETAPPNMAKPFRNAIRYQMTVDAGEDVGIRLCIVIERAIRPQKRNISTHVVYWLCGKVRIEKM